MQRVTNKLLSELQRTHITPVHQNIIELVERGFHVMFDKTTCEGVATKSDLKLTFQIGGENVYFDYSAYTKCGVGSFIDQLTELHKGLD